ncbi:MAG: hypothetical protein AAB701_01945 [Patescibacteria group bacterium]
MAGRRTEKSICLGCNIPWQNRWLIEALCPSCRIDRHKTGKPEPIGSGKRRKQLRINAY